MMRYGPKTQIFGGIIGMVMILGCIYWAAVVVVKFITWILQ